MLFAARVQSKNTSGREKDREVQEAMDETNGTKAVESWAEWFDLRARYYDNPLMKMAYYLDGQPVAQEVMFSVIDDVWKKLRAGGSDILLDVGGGVGLFAKAFHHKLKRVVVTDVSFSMSENGRTLNPDTPFSVCEASALPFASSSFSRVLCYSVFHYFGDLDHARRVLEELVRVAKKGGRILVGDIPFNVPPAEEKPASQREKTGTKPHYPPCLKHNLKFLLYEPGFFVNFFNGCGIRCTVMQQDVKGKTTVSSRFDILAEV